MMINTIVKNPNISNISFQGNLSKKILSGISKTLNNSFSRENENKTSDSQTKHLATDMLRYALLSKANFVVKNPTTTEDDIKLSCISALKDKNPYEKTIVYNTETKEIAGVYNGNKNTCLVGIDNSLPPNSLEIFHGHPQYKKDDITFTLPVSIEDFEILNKNSAVKKITAFDIDGNKSELSKADTFVKLTDEQTDDLKTEYLVELKKAMPSETQENYDYLTEYCHKHKKEAPYIMTKMYKQLLDFQYTPDGAKAIGKFWEKYSEKYHLNYISEF